MSEKYIETSNELNVYGSCDILVVGGGAAGHSAAVAAARANPDAKVFIMERYGYFGGDVTGGYVLMIPSLNWRKYSIIRGIQEEWFTRLDRNAPDAYMSPTLEEAGSNNPIYVNKWKGVFSCVKGRGENATVSRSPNFDPQQLKLEMDAMIEECPNIHMMLDCWGTKPVVENDKIKGVIFESKAGRQVVWAKIVIDCTGDLDIVSQTGALWFGKGGIISEGQRDNQTALVWRVTDVDYEAYMKWADENPDLVNAFNQELFKVAGYRTLFFPCANFKTVWFNNWLNGMNCTDLDDIRNTQLIVRDSIRRILAFCKRNLPFAFKDAYLMDIAPQLGTRCSRRLNGELVMTKANFVENPVYDDVVAWSSTGYCDAPIEIPYRALLAQKIDNLLAAGRHISADPLAIGAVQLIPQCVQTGQATGVAAAVAVKDGATAHTVDIKKVQYILSHEQDCVLPRQDNTDPELVKELEDNNYGRNGQLPPWLQ